jgi:glycosyltransferase involved in cell wall biosynthesis
VQLLIAIPCLNEAATVGGVVAAVPHAIPGITRTTILVVDDGSTDDTAAVARAAGALVIAHGANFGEGVAFRTAVQYGLDHAADLMVYIDGDAQFDPADIPKLIEPITAGRTDVVTASRFLDPALIPRMPWANRVGNTVMSRLLSALTGRQMHDVSCGFRAYSAEALLQLNLYGDFTHVQETILDLVFKRLRINEVPVAVRYFPGRQSRAAPNLLAYAVHTLGVIGRVYRDYYPLRLFNAAGVLAIIAGALFGARLIWHYLSTGEFFGEIWSGMVGGFLVMLGVVSVAVGLLTDMINRNRAIQERILYLVKRASRGTAPGHRPAVVVSSAAADRLDTITSPADEERAVASPKAISGSEPRGARLGKRGN